MPQHRSARTPTRARRLLRGGVVTVGAIAGFGILPAPSHAAAPHDWDGVAEFQSGDDWTLNTGNSCFDGLQRAQHLAV